MCRSKKMVKRTCLFRVLFIMYLSVNIEIVSSDNILVLPGPGYSHLRPMKGMVDILIGQYNHNVTFLVTETLAEHPGLKDLSSDIVTYDKKGNISKEIDKLVNIAVEGSFQNKSFLSLGQKMQSIMVNITHLYMSDSDIFKKLEGQQFKTVIIDPMLSLPFLIIAQQLSIPEIIHCASGFLPYTIYRIPSDYLAIPDLPVFPIPDSNSLMSRLQSTLMRIGMILIGTFGKSLFFPDDVVRKYLSASSMEEFYKKTNSFSFYLMDQDEVLDYPRPSLPNIAFVGGMSLSNSLNPLPTKIQRHIDAAKDGVVIVTFGSLSIMPKEFKDILFKAFQKVPEIHFIAKIDKSQFQERNILSVPWLPQYDLLANKRVKAFITHCGNSGQYEALYHGVPMIAIPISGDQEYNADRIVIKSFGVKLNHNTLTSEALERSIREVVYNGTYSKKIKIASEIYRSKPLNASQRAAYWVHHVTAFGSSHLRSSSHALSDYKYFGLDIFLLLSILTLSIIYLIIYIFRVLCRRCIKGKLKQD
ncbi:UDP-glucuronosyltransferase 1A1-like [Saccostrea cucullata]|uniref:UDP-glucuronosyltransferase 1A1-like n=1 Tax=Saccostrea cuccullata TaxID=36930 RepID=UPI002ED4C826